MGLPQWVLVHASSKFIYIILKIDYYSGNYPMTIIDCHRIILYSATSGIGRFSRKTIGGYLSAVSLMGG